MEAETSPLPPSQTTEPLKIAIDLGLSLAPFESEEWIGMGGAGYSVKTIKLYWMKGSNMHSGPFHTSDQALDFLQRWYTDFYLRYQQGDIEEMDQ